MGCLAAPAADPIQMLITTGTRLSVKRFTEYGANYSLFGALTAVVGDFQEADISAVLQRELGKSITC
jgi:hypothetical protein